MDFFGLFSMPNWLLITIIIIYILHIYFSWNYGTLEALGYNCEKPLPFFGNSLPEFFSVVHENDLKNNKKLSRIYGFYESRVPTLRISDPNILREILVKQFNNFTDRRFRDTSIFDPIVAKMIFVLSGEEWKVTRNVMSPTFTSGKLKQMVPLIEKTATKLKDIFMKKAEEGQSVDIKGVYLTYFIEVVSSCVFGLEMNNQSPKDKEILLKRAKKVALQSSILLYLALVIVPPKLLKVFKISLFNAESINFFRNIMLQAIEMRKNGKQRRNDFLQLLLDALKEAQDSLEPQSVSSSNGKDSNKTKTQDEAPTKHAVKAVLTSDGVLAQSLVFLIAGIDSTSKTLSMVTYCLAVNPECQEKLQQEVDHVLERNDGKVDCKTTGEMTYLDMFISETLRMYPSSTRLDRHCSNNITIENIFIPKGTFITIPVYAIHHDEEFYPDSFRFDPERFSPENKESRNPYTYLPFGTGPRNCLGLRFALMLLKLTLAHVLKDFAFVRSEETQEPLIFKKGVPNMIPSEVIQVKIERRRRS